MSPLDITDTVVDKEENKGENIMSNWVSYQNGNYAVNIDLDTGTKIRENDLDFLMQKQ